MDMNSGKRRIPGHVSEKWVWKNIHMN